jgi:small basic protein
MLAVIEEGSLGAVMRRLIVAAFLAVLSLTVLAAADRAEAGVRVRIDRASQTMAVIVDGIHRYTWPV